MATNHFPGWGISVIFDLTFLPGGGEFYSNFLENVKIPPYIFQMYCVVPSSHVEVFEITTQMA